MAKVKIETALNIRLQIGAPARHHRTLRTGDTRPEKSRRHMPLQPGDNTAAHLTYAADRVVTMKARNV